MVYTVSFTWERDVEALEGDGKVWDEAKLSLEVAVQPGVDWRGSLWTGESGEGPHKTAVLRQEQVVMVILQVKRMKRELHTWEEEASDEDTNYLLLHYVKKMTWNLRKQAVKWRNYVCVFK